MRGPQGCLIGFLANLFGGSRRASPAAALPKVIVNKKFVLAAEGDFFRVLRGVVGPSVAGVAEYSRGEDGTNRSLVTVRRSQIANAVPNLKTPGHNLGMAFVNSKPAVSSSRTPF